jgi:uncharacterized membrane protein
MFQQKFCQECNQNHNCKEIYQQLGNTKNPSVVFRVVIAFLVPLVVFIAALAIFKAILAGIINSKEAQAALSFLLALSMTFAVVLVIKAINKKLSKNK